MGQLLVVVHHTDNSPSLCYESELIPDPLAIGNVLCKMLALSSGSGIRCCTLRDFNRYSLGRDSYGNGKVRLQTEILAYTGQQLIPDPSRWR